MTKRLGSFIGSVLRAIMKVTIQLIKSICLRLDMLIELMQHLVTSHRTREESLENANISSLPKKGELLDIQDVIGILNISMATYYRMVQRGDLLPRRNGKRHYYFRSDIYVQLENSRRKGRI